MWRTSVVENTRGALDSSIYDGVVVTGADNVRYVAGAALPFLAGHSDRRVIVFWPKRAEPVCICPLEWASTIRCLSWIAKIQTYPADEAPTTALVDAVARTMCESLDGDALVGVDMNRVPYDFLMELEIRLPGIQLTACDDWLDHLRMRKTPQEQDLLAEVAYRTDHGIVGAVHHLSVKQAHTEKRLAEEIRVHCLERLLDLVGHHGMSQVASGEHAHRFWPLAPKFGVGWDRTPRGGELVRLEMRASLDGYWCDAARMMTMGEPNAAQKRAYETIVRLTEVAIGHLRPGVRCNEVFAAVKQEAGQLGVEMIGEMGVGHGVGVSAFERPYLCAGDDVELQVGMVVVLDPIICGPNEEIMRSKNTVLITAEGCEVLGWYKDWREPYITADSF